jgi:hypothetical protein
MIGVLRSERLALVSLLVAALIGVAAVVDHELKQRRINSAEVDDYYCRTQGIRCSGSSWHEIEDRWQTRQIAYEVAVICIGGAGTARLVYRVARLARRRL